MRRSTRLVVVFCAATLLVTGHPRSAPEGEADLTTPVYAQRVVEQHLVLEPVDADCEGSGYVFFFPQPAGGPWLGLTFGWDTSQTSSSSKPSLGFVVNEWVDTASCNSSCNCGGQVGTLTPLAAGPWATYSNVSSQGGYVVVYGDGIMARVHGQGPTRLYLRWER